MKKLSGVFVLVFLLYTGAFAQEVFLKTGKNFTTYDFNSDRGTAISEFLTGTGSSYEFGLGFPFLEKEGSAPDMGNYEQSRPTFLRYEVSLTLDDYDSYGGDLNNNYSWETTYAGVRNRLSILGRVGALELGLSGIVGASKMITGTQVVNKSRFDLSEFEDFSGVLLQGGLGGSASFQVVNQGFISLSYDYTRSLRIGEQTSDQLSFKNQRIVLGVHFKLN
jgi:hypothetical protein